MPKKPMAILIEEKARKCKVHPKFILCAIAVLCKKHDAKEHDVAGLFFNMLASDFKAAAQKKLESKQVRTRTSGGLELSPIRSIPGLTKYISDEDLLKIGQFLPANDPVLFLHQKAYNHVIGDFLRMRLKWKAAKYKGGDPDAIQVAKLLFPELIERYRELARVFRRFDMILN